MTQAKLKNLVAEKSKKYEENKMEMKPKYLDDKYVQIAAWLLLTLGLCIIISTFYLAIKQRYADEIFGIDESFKSIEQRYQQIGEDMSVNIVARQMDDKVTTLAKIDYSGCEETSCEMVCTKTNNIFEQLFESMNESNCTFFNTLAINNQHFKQNVLHNNWKYGEQTVKELAIVNSNITIIHNGAFNSPMFSTTFLLYWRNLNLHIIDGGALLGLHSLKYLVILTKLNCLDRAFFQPVQTSLTYLKLHGDLTVSTNENLFGISKMDKLHYLDLSRNNINGLITRRTFQGTPNLRYLIMAKNKVTSISSDSFTHLIGKLFLLDLSDNMLTTLSDGVLAPLLRANERTIINLAMNPWACNCNLRPFVNIYKEFRSIFMDALYCKSPHALYGLIFDKIDFEKQNCEIEATILPELVRSDEIGVLSTSKPFNNETITFSSEDMDLSSSMESQNIQLRCWNVYDTENIDMIDNHPEYISIEPHSTSITASVANAQNLMRSIDIGNDVRDSKSEGYTSSMDYFNFKPPEYEFELYLLENNSVKVTVPNYKTDKNYIYIIWFDDNIDESSQESTPCLPYTNPYVITEPLKINGTYTFCYIYADGAPISPFNCLPLHVPAYKENVEDVWIPHDQKPFTIGMLCLIFIVSIFSGATVAYLGIKAYPDLLEGSKNVLVVKKKPDQKCFVSTITDAEYMKRTSFKKTSSRSSSMKKPSFNSISPSNTFEGSTGSASVKSSLTCFDDVFQSLPNFKNDEYEMPKPMPIPVEELESTYESRCMPNTYVASSPSNSPPPLPIRNSRSFTENTY